MIKKVETSNLLKQTTALGNYLDDMLHDATRVAAEVAVVPLDIEPRESALLSEVTIDEVALEEDYLLKPGIEETKAKSSNVDNLNIQTTEIPPEENRRSNHLEINQFPLQCLMFRVGENQLSIPLIQMSGVIPWSNELTLLPQSPDWVLGILKHRECNLRVLDSSKILGIPAITGQTPSHFLALSDSKWAISCDFLGDVVTLEYEDIQWNKDTDNATTLGKIRESLAYLLSPSGIINSLNVVDEI